MKLLTWPILLIVASTLAAIAGGFMYATSGLTYYAPTKTAIAPGATGSSQAPSTDNVSGNDNTTAASSPGPAAAAESGGNQGRGFGGGQWGGGGTPEEQAQRRQERMQRMAAALGLTDAQKQQIETIRQTITDRTQRRAAIMAILTPEQQAKMEQMRAQWGNRGGNGGAGNAAPANNAPAGGGH